MGFARALWSLAVFGTTCLFSLPASGWPHRLSDKKIEAAEQLFQASEGGFLWIADGGTQVHFRVFDRGPKADGAIVLLPGFTESVMKYKEVILDLHSRGYSVFALDHRGQGESRHLAMSLEYCNLLNVVWDDPWAQFDLASQVLIPKPAESVCLSDVVHVDDAELYVKDLHQFVNQVVLPRTAGRVPLFLLGHSMGGAVATRYLAEHPGVFVAAAVTSPAYRINTGLLSIQEAYYFSSLIANNPYMPLGIPAGIPIAIPYAPERDSFAFTDAADDGVVDGANNVTHSAWRFDWAAADRKAYPEIGAMNRASLAWIRAAIELGWAIEEGASSVEDPLLVIAAEEERLMVRSVAESVCAQAADCRFQLAEGARHEILMEVDDVRSNALASILSFFKHQERLARRLARRLAK